MNYKLRTKHGLTLTEMTVVVASIVLLAAIGVPAIRAFFHSFETEAGTKNMISAAFASARAMAAAKQQYVGIRFQKAYRPDSTLEAPQYMVFIIHDAAIMAHGFRAIEGLKPLKLPASVGVMDLTVVSGRNTNNPVNPAQQTRLDDPVLSAAQKDDLLKNIPVLTDISTFSIIFSPTGKLVICGVHVRNKDGQYDTSANAANVSNDTVFNKLDRVKIDNSDQTRPAMFCQDDYYGELDNVYGNLGLGPEPSRNSFIIYDTKEFIQTYKRGQAFSGYLYRLVPQAIYINPYTGTIISE